MLHPRILKLFSIGLGFFSLNSFAAKSQYLQYFDSLEKEFLIDSGHLLDVSEHIFLAKPSLLNRWLLGDESAASYNHYINTIELNPSIFIMDGERERIKTFAEMNTGVNGNKFFVDSELIFHELAHADFDVFLEENKHTDIYKLLTNDISDWFKQTHPKMNAKTATHELFGYTAGNFIRLTGNAISETLNRHGIKYLQKSCLDKKALISLDKKNQVSKELRFKNLGDFDDDMYFYIIPMSIFTSGKAIEIKKFPKNLRKRLMDYFILTYNFSKNKDELIQKMNNSHYRENLRKCYEILK